MLDAGIHLRKSLCCKEIDYRAKPDNDNFRSFSAAFKDWQAFFVLNFFESLFHQLVEHVILLPPVFVYGNIKLYVYAVRENLSCGFY